MKPKLRRSFIISIILITVFLIGLYLLYINPDIDIAPSSRGLEGNPFDLKERAVYLISFGSVFVLVFVAYLFYLKEEKR